MVLNPIDKSNYLRGLLILIKIHRSINEIEKKRIKEVSSVLGFNRGFVDNAINELLDNEYLIETPPKFTNPRLAETFIKEAIKISMSENVLNIHNLHWLIALADNNNLPKQWLFMELEFLLENENQNINDSLEIQNYLNEEATAA